MRLAIGTFLILALPVSILAQAVPKLSLELKLVRSEGADSRDFWVGVEVVNATQQILTVSLGPPQVDCKFTVVGPDGRPVPLTKEGERGRTMPQIDDSRSFRLEPGQRASRGSVHISNIFDFSKPGTYRITATQCFEAPVDEKGASSVLEVKIP